MTLSGFQIQGVCEWCKQESDELRPIRDWEEALTGPEHWVCPECAGKEREGFDAATAEWAAYMEKRYVENQIEYEKEAAEEAAIPIG
jgi:hypothetical protein